MANENMRQNAFADNGLAFVNKQYGATAVVKYSPSTLTIQV